MTTQSHCSSSKEFELLCLAVFAATGLALELLSTPTRLMGCLGAAAGHVRGTGIPAVDLRAACLVLLLIVAIRTLEEHTFREQVEADLNL